MTTICFTIRFVITSVEWSKRCFIDVTFCFYSNYWQSVWRVVSRSSNNGHARCVPIAHRHCRTGVESIRPEAGQWTARSGYSYPARFTHFTHVRAGPVAPNCMEMDTLKDNFMTRKVDFRRPGHFPLPAARPISYAVTFGRVCWRCECRTDSWAGRGRLPPTITAIWKQHLYEYIVVDSGSNKCGSNWLTFNNENYTVVPY